MLRAGRVTVHIHTGTFQLLPSCLSPGTAALSHSIHQWIPSSTVSPDAATHTQLLPRHVSLMSPGPPSLYMFYQQPQPNSGHIDS